MSNRVFISICIPAYKHVEYLKRLLDSIVIQTFKDFEVVVTDDSPGDEVRILISEYQDLLKIVYQKNDPICGSPGNWNQSILKANGEWIKLMHDDDWFSSHSSLELFAKSTQHNKKFIFSAYTNFYSDTKTENVFFPQHYRGKIISNPMLLLPKNIIGPPSVTMVHKSIAQEYDIRMKWRVDIDFYIRVIQIEKDIFYINQPLINVGLGELQVTNSCLNNPAVELPEGLLLLTKFGIKPLKNIWIYDTWWRLMRNMQIRNEKQLSEFTSTERWPAVIKKLVKHQSKVKMSWLKFGVASKLFMLISYLLNRPSLKNS